MGRLYGYARVSTTDQAEALQQQRAALESAGCSVIREEQQSGTTRQGREELERLLEFIDAGDTLVVWKLDRLARSVLDTAQIVRELQDKGAALKIVDQNIDTATATGRAFLDMLSVFAEFETNLRKERQRAGIERAKKEGKYTGRKKALSHKQVLDIKDRLAAGETKTALAQEFKVTRKTLYAAISG